MIVKSSKSPLNKLLMGKPPFLPFAGIGERKAVDRYGAKVFICLLIIRRSNDYQQDEKNQNNCKVVEKLSVKDAAHVPHPPLVSNCSRLTPIRYGSRQKRGTAFAHFCKVYYSEKKEKLEDAKSPYVERMKQHAEDVYRSL